MQARVLTPPMFMAQDPQMPSLQDRRKVKVGSTSFLIFTKASNTIGPTVFRSRVYSYNEFHMFDKDKIQTLNQY
jgi:hypothetical protein